MITRTSPPSPRRRGILLSAAAPALLLTLAACASPGGAAPAAQPDADAEPAARELAAPRLVASYEGGLLVLEGDTLEVAAELELPGFLRVNPAGDGRHVLVSTDAGFRVLDTGLEAEQHGDHAHYYGAEPQLTELVFEADHPGHVTTNEGVTALFADGSGEVQLFEASELADAAADAAGLDALELRGHESAAAHHGVAVALPGGELLSTLGTAEARTGVAVYDASGAELARDERCPGVHGETVAAGGTIVVGCQDGALAYRDGVFTKVASPDAYGRIGTQAGSPESAVVLGDYKTDAEAELERPTRVSLIDTETGTMRLVELGTSYTFRSLARGPHGEALVLGTDGAIHVIDPAAGTVTATIPVLGEWTEPLDWQQARPALRVDGHRAYVTDPAASTVHLVDLDAGELLDSVELPAAPIELSTVAAGH
ncbi:zinc metallochaperone AztD [Agromyces mediolanus]|uniref:zinc metallochaperone AztD n=1 Tax=Agromyces mediolanus TaxID=41986 RepID=UPI003836B943